MGEVINLAEHKKKVDAEETDPNEPNYWDDLEKLLEARKAKLLKARRQHNEKIRRELRSTPSKK